MWTSRLFINSPFGQSSRVAITVTYIYNYFKRVKNKEAVYGEAN